MEPDTGN